MAKTHLYSDAPDAAHMINGVWYSLDDFVERYRRLYSTLDGQTAELGEPTVTLLSRDAVVVSTQGPFEARLKDGDSFGGQFTWTLVWVRRNG